MAGDERPGVLTLERRQRLMALMEGDGAPAEASPGLAAAVLRDGAMSAAAAFGRREVAPDKALFAWSKMRVASISKLVTAIGALTLVDAGRLDPDADISAHLGFALRNPAFPDQPITLRHILTHTSSLRDGEVYWGFLGERIESYFTPTGGRYEGGAHFSTDAPPGAKEVYCNLAYGLVATAIETISQTRFDAFMLRTVFAPLGLSCSYNWSGTPRADIAEAATLYLRNGAWKAAMDAPDARTPGPVFSIPGADIAAYTLGENGLIFSPQGGLRASIVDLAVLAELILGGGARQGVRLYSEAAGDLLMPLSADAAPMGARILPAEVAGRRLLGHGAEAYGLRGGLWLDPAAGAGFAYLSTGGPAVRAPGPAPDLTAIEARIIAVLAEAAFG